jgi:hypothetical protein
MAAPIWLARRLSATTPVWRVGPAFGDNGAVIRVSRVPRSALVTCLTLAAVLATAVGSANGASWSGRYSIWHKGAFTTQYVDYSCVGATVQITLNLINGTRDRSKRHQIAYLDYAQAHSKYPVNDLGADAEGWAKALTHFGAGDGWGWATATSVQSALKLAARQIRITGKPIGLLTFHGGHAWLMTGFESTADPQQTSNYSVTAAEVLGPLYPDGTFNGKGVDPGPRTWMSPSTLGRRFNTYYQPGQPAWNGKWVMVVPRASQAALAAAPSLPSGQQDLPDLGSVYGWSWMVSRLALRDLVWRG